MDNENLDFNLRGCKAKPKVYQKSESLYSQGFCKRNSFDWLGNICNPVGYDVYEFIEVRFKNSRKDIFKAPPNSDYQVGDIVAVEASPGHDIGIVTLVGDTVRMQMKKKKMNPDSPDFKKVYRRARSSDVEKWANSVTHESRTLQRSKNIIKEINLTMKLNDVEFQGDGTKATFYYTADDRVDFRELIKMLADEFSVRIEMKQIGARQEAGSLGGLGTCGRELCCSSWLSDFKSVSTNSARIQQLSINPQKLAGQCSKLKCCLNYEHECYVDAMKDFPPSEAHLKTHKGTAIYVKTDVFKKIMWYCYEKDSSNLMAIPVEKVKEIIADNKKNRIPDKLEDFAIVQEKKIDFEHVEDDLNRFDKHKNKK